MLPGSINCVLHDSLDDITVELNISHPYMGQLRKILPYLITKLKTERCSILLTSSFAAITCNSLHLSPMLFSFRWNSYILFFLCSINRCSFFLLSFIQLDAMPTGSLASENWICTQPEGELFNYLDSKRVTGYLRKV